MRNNEGIFWGLVLVLLGGLLLLDNMGYLPANINVWAIFWPLVLIILGIRGVMQAFRPRSEASQEPLRLPLEGARRATVRVHFGAGELNIDDRAANDELVNGTFGGGVEHNLRRGTDETVVDLRMPSQNIPIVWPDGVNGRTWTVGLNPTIPMALDLEVGASSNRLHLRNLLISDLRVQTGASSTEIEMPARAGFTRAVVKSGAASVEVRIPEGVAARINAHGGLHGVSVDEMRFPRSGSEYRSPDYETAANRLDLEFETGLGSVQVR